MTPLEALGPTGLAIALAEGARQVAAAFDRVVAGEVPIERAAADVRKICSMLGSVVPAVGDELSTNIRWLEQNRPDEWRPSKGTRANQKTTRRARRRSTKETTS
jgi:hypothetical protein